MTFREIQSPFHRISLDKLGYFCLGLEIKIPVYIIAEVD